ncbi:hypothetical protein V5799_011901 [Amblyomma americanum]|uniref:Uncharacterized protein n=1 Tax=Amblyomma americanum TaxID=6943 RepID=A0AAQ4EFK3_AMBAM
MTFQCKYPESPAESLSDLDHASVASNSVQEQHSLQPFEALDGNFHLANCIKMPEKEFNYIMKTKSEDKVAREMARYLWTPAEMKERCLAGQPCRRTLDSFAKQRAAPAKVEVLMGKSYILFGLQLISRKLIVLLGL